MATDTPRVEQPYRVAVVRALPGLGDFLCAVPALRSLRQALPYACIDVIGLPVTRPLAHRFPAYIDQLVAFPGFPGIPEVPADPRRLLTFLSRVRQTPYDLVLQMHGDGTNMNDFSLALGTSLVYGFHPAEAQPPRTGHFMPYDYAEPEVRRNLRLVQSMGAEPCGEHLEFPLSAMDAAELARIPGATGLEPGGYAVVNPGASAGDRRWLPEHFAAVADRLAAEGITPVLTGVYAEAALCAEVIDRMLLPAVDLSGQTSLGALAALISGAAIVVANDTGTSHLADALAVPSVVVFSGSDPRRWAPLDDRCHRVVDLASARWSSLSLASGPAASRPWSAVSVVGGGPYLPLAGVLAEVEHLLAIGGGSVS